MQQKAVKCYIMRMPRLNHTNSFILTTLKLSPQVKNTDSLFINERIYYLMEALLDSAG